MSDQDDARIKRMLDTVETRARQAEEAKQAQAKIDAAKQKARSDAKVPIANFLQMAKTTVAMVNQEIEKTDVSINLSITPAPPSGKQVLSFAINPKYDVHSSSSLVFTVDELGNISWKEQIEGLPNQPATISDVYPENLRSALIRRVEKVFYRR